MARRITRSSSRSPFTTVCLLYYSADGSELLILPLVNGFHDGLRAVLLSGWQQIVHNSPRQRLSRRLRAILLSDGTVLLVLPLVVRFHEGCRRIALRMAPCCSFFHSSMAFPTFRVLYCSADGSVLLVLPFVDGFHGLHAVLLSGGRRIAPSSIRPLLS